MLQLLWATLENKIAFWKKKDPVIGRLTVWQYFMVYHDALISINMSWLVACPMTNVKMSYDFHQCLYGKMYTMPANFPDDWKTISPVLPYVSLLLCLYKKGMAIVMHWKVWVGIFILWHWYNGVLICKLDGWYVHNTLRLRQDGHRFPNSILNSFSCMEIIVFWF